MKKLRLVLLLLGVGLLATFSAAVSMPTAAESTLPPTFVSLSVATEVLTKTAVEVPTELPTSTVRPVSTVTVTDTRDSGDWKNWPVVPEAVSSSLRTLYLQGLQVGNDAHRFSKIGDCQNNPVFYLAGYDDITRYNLGDYVSLQETVRWFSGQFKRESAAVRGGMNVAGVQSSLFTKTTVDAVCEIRETPLTCEIRANAPSIALVSFEELWDGDTSKYETYYRKLIDVLFQNKILPILATTATNESANAIVAKLAVEYHLPVWNLWRALQPLRSHGIADGFHLTQWGNIYDFSVEPFSGWHVRNLTALQSLDAVLRRVR